MNLLRALARALPSHDMTALSALSAPIQIRLSLNDPAPRNMLAARFSVPFAVSTAIMTERTDITSFTINKLTNSSIGALATRVSVVEDAAITAALPDRRPARITLTLQDGRQFTSETQTNRGN